MKPDISVVMSVYNGEDYLSEAIESLIGQSFTNWELIVINDCSTDSTPQILAGFAAADSRIKVYTNEVNLKLPSSLNKGIGLSTGKYVARMDADDICLPTRLEEQFRFMEENPELALSSCRFMTLKNGVYASGGAGGRTDHEALKAMLLVANPILHPGVIAKRQVMTQYPYDTSLTCTEDLELWTRLVMAGLKIAIQPECLLIYRLHDKQITGTTLDRQRTEVLGIQKKYYASLLEGMDEKTESFYINGIYFKKQSNTEQFLAYAKWLRAKTKMHFNANAINYALFEILAEYKRVGILKADVYKAMLTLPPFFLVKEILRRKNAAGRDIAKFIQAAEKRGLKQTHGTKAFPIFERTNSRS